MRVSKPIVRTPTRTRTRPPTRTRTPVGPGSGRLLLAGPHNSKLGPLVHSFSIPAGRTCPGKTAQCARLCYAARGFFVMPAVARQHRLNLLWSLGPDFVPAMIQAIRRSYARVVRIHVAGDFYSRAYLKKWLQIVRACPRVRFFAYTRSWRRPALLPLLLRLGRRPNVHLWWSEDGQTGPSPCVIGIRVAYLVAEAADDPLVPAHADLVFRDARHRRQRPERVKRIGTVLVCPHEQGGTASLPLTCTACRLCFTAGRPQSVLPHPARS